MSAKQRESMRIHCDTLPIDNNGSNNHTREEKNQHEKAEIEIEYFTSRKKWALPKNLASLTTIIRILKLKFFT